MWVFLGSDCLLFGALISTYLLLRHRSVDGMRPEDIFDIPFTSVSSFVLLMSSLTMALAVGAIHRGDVRRSQTFLLTTALLGAIFIGGQVYEFTSFYREGVGYTTNIFSSAFYTLTGFHGVHVSVGIVMLASLVVLWPGQARHRARRDRRDHRSVLALRRHRVDPDLHRRLPHPVGRDAAMTTTTPRRLPRRHRAG